MTDLGELSLILLWNGIFESEERYSNAPAEVHW
jgi:hypothetical protein